MISTYASGIVTGTIGSEIFISSPNVPGKYRLYLDKTNMAAGDFLEVRRYKTIISGGNPICLDVLTSQGAQFVDTDADESEEVWNDLSVTNAVRFSIKQTLGTARQYGWAVLQEDVYVLVTGSVAANVSITGTVDANVLLWRGSQPNVLISGTVDAFAHYSNPVTVADKTGFSLANPQAFDLIGNVTGTITNVLNVVNSVTAGVVTGSVLGNVNGSVGSVVNPVGINTGSFILAIADQVWDETLSQHLLVGSTGEKLYSVTGSSGGSDPWLTNLPGSYTPGQAGHILASRMPTGTVNANLIQWLGATPNALISGTVDAFTHYTNYPSSTITGSVDANVITWRGNQPNNLISGTVDAFVHYSNPVQAFVTGTVDANVQLWRSTQPNVLISGTVDAYAHYGVPTANENADALLKRDWTAITGEASRSVLNALRFIRNKFSTTAHANKVTIYKEDDTSEAYQKDVTTDATADPIVEG